MTMCLRHLRNDRQSQQNRVCFMQGKGQVIAQTGMRDVGKRSEQRPDSELLRSSSERLKAGLSEGLRRHFAHRYPAVRSVRPTPRHQLRDNQIEEERWGVRQLLRQGWGSQRAVPGLISTRSFYTSNGLPERLVSDVIHKNKQQGLSPIRLNSRHCVEPFRVSQMRASSQVFLRP